MRETRGKEERDETGDREIKGEIKREREREREARRSVRGARGRGDGMPSDFASFNQFTPIVLRVPRFRIIEDRPPTLGTSLPERIDAIARIILNVPSL